MTYQRPATKPYPPLRKSISRRKWLNPRAGSGHIEWSVNVPTFHKSVHKKDKGGYIDSPDIELSIADCTRKITLDFWPSIKKDGQKVVLRKVDILIDELQDFRAAIEGAYERQKELKIAHPNAKVW